MMIMMMIKKETGEAYVRVRMKLDLAIISESDHAVSYFSHTSM